MPDPGPNRPSGNRTSFASMIASFAGGPSASADPWDLSALANDVATISYEKALRTHRRIGPPEPLPPSVESNSPAPIEPALSRSSHKTASITFRLTAEEHALLQTRATEAGLSTSAYLRSCVFEAESLRAQVKDVLTQMRASTQQLMPAASENRSITPRRFPFLPRWMHHSSNGN